MNYPLYLVLFGDLPYMLAFFASLIPSALREGVIGETVGFPIP
jgi:hypothetical protein